MTIEDLSVVSQSNEVLERQKTWRERDTR